MENYFKYFYFYKEIKKRNKMLFNIHVKSLITIRRDV